MRGGAKNAGLLTLGFVGIHSLLIRCPVRLHVRSNLPCVKTGNSCIELINGRSITEALISLFVLRVVHLRAPGEVLFRVQLPDGTTIECRVNRVTAEEYEIHKDDLYFPGIHIVFDNLRKSLLFETLAERALVIAPERNGQRRIRLAYIRISADIHILTINNRCGARPGSRGCRRSGTLTVPDDGSCD